MAPPMMPPRLGWPRMTLGEVPERLNGPVSKTGMGLVLIGGSNPPLSVVPAITMRNLCGV